ncbi:MAG: Acyl dehydratase [Myxococcaceae bacterium]|nr:Acyl dehydratase [Myxococcaceae bacterium]
MSVSNRHILEQGAALGALGKVALKTIETQLLGKKPAKSAPAVPGRLIQVTLPPRSPELIAAYVKNVGGDPSAYKNTLPAHFFPQWGFAVGSEALSVVPYPLSKILNVGCNLDVRKPIPAGEPLEVSAQLVEIDDDGRRAVLTTRVITSTRSAPEALIAEMITMVPLKRDKSASSSNGAKKEKEVARVPDGAQELAFFDVGANAGLDFAKLTGDFNPIHWIKPAARASGFPNVILHGFGTMARAIEGLNRNLFAGDVTRMKKWSCRFTKPLVLPSKAGLYVQGNDVFVGVAAGGPAYLVGSYQV